MELDEIINTHFPYATMADIDVLIKFKNANQSLVVKKKSGLLTPYL